MLQAPVRGFMDESACVAIWYWMHRGFLLVSRNTCPEQLPD